MRDHQAQIYVLGDSNTLSKPLDEFLRDPFWLLRCNLTGTMVLLTPFEVNALFDTLTKMEHAVLFMFQPYHQKPTKSIPALQDLPGFSIPKGNCLTFADNAQFAELNLFAGNLYFENSAQEQWICSYIGKRQI